jgi:hypothetical protein
MKSGSETSFHPEMALFHNFCVNLRNCLFPLLAAGRAIP